MMDGTSNSNDILYLENDIDMSVIGLTGDGLTWVSLEVRVRRPIDRGTRVCGAEGRSGMRSKRGHNCDAKVGKRAQQGTLLGY